MGELSKFDKLRMKTERELVQLIHHELDLGVREARQALSADNWASAEGHYFTAQRAYADVSRLTPLIGETSDDQQGQLEPLVQRLREMLDGLSRTPTTENIVPRSEQALKSQKESHAVCC